MVGDFSTVLIYAPELEGHPRVYCRVICDALPSGSCRIVLALGENDRATIADSVDLQPLLNRDGIVIVRTNELSGSGNNHLTAEEILGLQTSYHAHKTLLLEAEKFAEQFKRIGTKSAPRLSGTTYGIFANTAEWYPGENSFTGEKRRLFSHSIRRSLGNVKRAVFGRKKSAEYFNRVTLLKKRSIDYIITKDERLADRGIDRVVWMPEISRVNVDLKAIEPTTEDHQRERELAEFKAQHADKKVLLYFGDAAYYKGYDLFLELLNRHPDLAGVHAGRIADENQLHMYTYDATALRKQLLQSGRLLTTDRYVSSEFQKSLYFSQMELYATTHRLALSSSTMLQASELGKPLLVPDRGLLGYRVSANKLGLTYRYGDVDDLYGKLIEMTSQPLDRYCQALERFARQHSFERINQFWRDLLLPTQTR